HAFRTYHAQLAGREAELGVAGVLTDQLRIAAGRTGHLAAAAELQLDVVHDRADRHVLERHRVARLNVRGLGGDDLVAGLQTLRRQDVGQLAVFIADERDERRAVRIVLEAL